MELKTVILEWSGQAASELQILGSCLLKRFEVSMRSKLFSTRCLNNDVLMYR